MYASKELSNERYKDIKPDVRRHTMGDQIRNKNAYIETDKEVDRYIL